MNKKENLIGTEINLLSLPLYKSSSKKGPSVIIDTLSLFGEDTKIKISNGDNIGTFHRKLILVLEYLYKIQNPYFETNEIITSYTEIQTYLQYTNKASNVIWNALVDLSSVTIETELSKKVEVDGVTKIQKSREVFNIIARAKQIKTDSKQSKGLYTTSILIELNSWHIENLKQKYYRIINIDMMISLHSALAIRLFDFFIIKGFYKNKAGKYIQKNKIQVLYKELMKFCRASEQSTIKDIKKQMKRPFQELQERGVLLDFEVHKNAKKDLFLIFYLNKKFQFSESNQIAPVELPLEFKNDERVKSCLNYGVTENQMKDILTEKKISLELIENKIIQMEYLLKTTRQAVKNEGRYLYMSIIQDWVVPEFEKYYHKKKKRQKQAQNTQDKMNYDEYEKMYQDYLYDSSEKHWEMMTQDEKEQITAEIEYEIKTQYESSILSETSFFNFYVDLKRTDYITKTMKLKTFEQFLDEKKIGQIDIFE